jgi:hypothetical protein
LEGCGTYSKRLLKRREEMERTELELAIELMHELNNNVLGIMACLELLKDVVP